MARSTTLFVLLAVLVIQVAQACSGPFDGEYYIKQGVDHLATGNVPLVWPPADLAVRIKEPRNVFPWLIKAAQGGYTIQKPLPHSNFVYSLLEDGKKPIFSVQKQPGIWAISPAGDGLFTIQLANNDLLLTSKKDDGSVHLRPADGSSSQKWTLTKDLNGYRSLYPNRFQHVL
jgi:hypothetical protein